MWIRIDFNADPDPRSTSTFIWIRNQEAPHNAVKRYLICCHFFGIFLASWIRLQDVSYNAVPYGSGSTSLTHKIFAVDASLEADVAKGRRDWAISERDKVKHVCKKMSNCSRKCWILTIWRPQCFWSVLVLYSFIYRSGSSFCSLPCRNFLNNFLLHLLNCFKKKMFDWKEQNRSLMPKGFM